MLYHALATADRGTPVHLVGHLDTALPDRVRTHAGIRLVALPSPRGARRHALPSAVFALVAAGNVAEQAVRLAAALWDPLADSCGLIVQSPPPLPTLPLVRLVSRLRRVPLVVDWHNLGHALLAQRLGETHPVPRLVQRLEYGFGRLADHHLAVTAAMAERLAERLGAPVAVLPDQPARGLRPLEGEARRRARQELGARLGVPALDDAVVVLSPTSWTADEDFSDLWTAIEASEDVGPTQRVFVLTGDGPRRADGERAAARLSRGRTRVVTGWLEEEEYRRLLGAADLGLSMHRSASGLDLPMKLLDFLGSGLPVLALDYGPCLRACVRDGIEGRWFTTAEELTDELEALIDDGDEVRRALARRIRQAPRPRWDEAWLRVVAPLLGGEPDR
jgi:beta-1,4-mannosyltransferase